MGSVKAKNCFGLEKIGCGLVGMEKPKGLHIIFGVLILMVVLLIIARFCINRQLRLLQTAANERFQNVWLPQVLCTVLTAHCTHYTLYSLHCTHYTVLTTRLASAAEQQEAGE
jgi:hypothetical protein